MSKAAKGVGAVCGFIIGGGFALLDIVGIVVGFKISVGTGIAALLVPPYGIYLGFRAIFGV